MVISNLRPGSGAAESRQQYAEKLEDKKSLSLVSEKKHPMHRARRYSNSRALFVLNAGEYS